MCIKVIPAVIFVKTLFLLCLSSFLEIEKYLTMFGGRSADRKSNKRGRRTCEFDSLPTCSTSLWTFQWERHRTSPSIKDFFPPLPLRATSKRSRFFLACNKRVDLRFLSIVFCEVMSDNGQAGCIAQPRRAGIRRFAPRRPPASRAVQVARVLQVSGGLFPILESGS